MGLPAVIYGNEVIAFIAMTEERDEHPLGSDEWLEADLAIRVYLDTLPVAQRVDRMADSLAVADAMVAGAKVEIVRLRERIDRAERLQEGIKAGAAEFMATLGVKRVEGAHSSLALVPGNWRSEYTDESLVPAEYWDVEVVMPEKTWDTARDLLHEAGHTSLLADARKKRILRKSRVVESLRSSPEEGVPGAYLVQDQHVRRK